MTKYRFYVTNGDSVVDKVVVNAQNNNLAFEAARKHFSPEGDGRMLREGEEFAGAWDEGVSAEADIDLLAGDGARTVSF